MRLPVITPLLLALIVAAGTVGTSATTTAGDAEAEPAGSFKSKSVSILTPGTPGKTILDTYEAPLSGYWVFPKEIMGWSCALQPPTGDLVHERWVRVTRRLECIRGDGSVAGRTWDYHVACGYLTFGVSIDLGEGAVTQSGRLLTTTATIQVLNDTPMEEWGGCDEGERLLTPAEWDLVRKR